MDKHTVVLAGRFYMSFCWHRFPKSIIRGVASAIPRSRKVTPGHHSWLLFPFSLETGCLLHPAPHGSWTTAQRGAFPSRKSSMRRGFESGCCVFLLPAGCLDDWWRTICQLTCLSTGLHSDEQTGLSGWLSQIWPIDRCSNRLLTEEGLAGQLLHGRMPDVAGTPSQPHKALNWHANRITNPPVGFPIEPCNSLPNRR